jgi:hypothetical protein
LALLAATVGRLAQIKLCKHPGIKMKKILLAVFSLAVASIANAQGIDQAGAPCREVPTVGAGHFSHDAAGSLMRCVDGKWMLYEKWNPAKPAFQQISKEQGDAILAQLIQLNNIESQVLQQLMIQNAKK